MRKIIEYANHIIELKPHHLRLHRQLVREDINYRTMFGDVLDALYSGTGLDWDGAMAVIFRESRGLLEWVSPLTYAVEEAVSDWEQATVSNDWLDR